MILKNKLISQIILLICTGLFTAFILPVQAQVVEKPDNISDASCVIPAIPQTWGIRESTTHNQTTTLNFASVFAGDLNNDGYPELVTLTSAQLVGIDDGQFAEKMLIYMGPNHTTVKTITAPANAYFSLWAGCIALAKTKISGKDTALIITHNSDGKVHAFNINGVKVWTSPVVSNFVYTRFYPVGVADFNGDGIPEIYCGHDIFNSVNGQRICTKTTGNFGWSNSWSVAYPTGSTGTNSLITRGIVLPAVADIDGDGKLEFIGGNEIYKVNLAAGTMSLMKSINPPYDPLTPSFQMHRDGKTQVADIDLDGNLDVIVSGTYIINNVNNYAYVWVWSPAKNKVLARTHVPYARNQSYPFIGDIDGDGRPEILFITSLQRTNAPSSYDYVWAFKYDGTDKLSEFWRLSHSDRSGSTGITLFDFNHDNIPEIVYRDESHVRIINGSGKHHITGAPTAPYDLASFLCYSNTGHEYPIVADIDGDGQAEIVANGYGKPSTFPFPNGPLRIFRPAVGTTWAPARKVWNQFAYNVVNINEDLSVPKVQFNPATVFPGLDGVLGTTDDVRPFNAFLLQQTMLNTNGDPLWLAPDYVIHGTPTTVHYPAGDSLVITVCVKNQGDATGSAPFYITVYKNARQNGNAMATKSFPNIPVPGGPAVCYSIKVENISTASSLHISINDKGEGTIVNPECNTTNGITTLMMIETTLVHPTCYNSTDGKITVSKITGGSGSGYQYSKDDGVTWQTSNVFASLPAGTYKIKAKDGTGRLSATKSVTLINPAIVAFGTPTLTHLSCYGQNTGKIVVPAPTGGSGTGYQYSKDDGVTWQTSNTFSTLAAGTYKIKVKDSKGCLSATKSVTITQPAAIAFANPTLTHPTCNGQTTGKIVVPAPTGGSGTGYQYSKDNGATWQTSNTFSALAAGTYTIRVKDSNGCPSPGKAVTITQPAVVAFGNPTLTNPTCYGQVTGKIVVPTPTGGSGTGYQYSKDNGVTWQTSNTFSSLAVGTYTIKVKDSKGCLSAAKSVTITQPAVVAFGNPTLTHVTCNGQSTGKIVVPAPTGGSGTGYQYSKDDGTTWQTSNTFSSLAAGTYKIKVKDSNGCLSAIKSVTITQPAIVAFGNPTLTPPTCNGQVTGKIVVPTPTGGSGTGYQYSKDNGVTWQASNTFGGLAAGAYTIKVKDSNGCLSATKSVTITQPAVVAFGNPTLTHPTCNGQSTGKIVVPTPTGGSGTGYQYSKDNGVTWQASNTFSSLAAGAYTIKVKDNKGCLSATKSVTITQPAVVAFGNPTLTHPTCNGQTTGKIVVPTPTGGSGTGYQYSKDNGATWQTSNTFSSLAAGTYTIKVKDSNGCLSAAKSVTITQPAIVAFNTPSKINVTCNGSNNGKITIPAPTGGSGTGYQYSKDGGTTWQTSNIFDNLPAGAYIIKVKDSKGCLSANTNVLIEQPAVISYTVSKTNISCNGGSDGSLVVSGVTGGTAPYKYSFNGAAYQSANSINGLQPGNHTVRIQDANNCVSSVTTVSITEPGVILPAGDVSAGLTCLDSVAIIVIANSKTGVTYKIFDKLSGGTMITSKPGNGSTLNIEAGIFSGDTTLYVETFYGSCTSVTRIPVTITYYDLPGIHPDIRIQTCPGMGNINLSKYLDTAGFELIKWTPVASGMPAIGTTTGIINTNDMEAKYTYAYGYVFKNNCYLHYGKLYITAVDNEVKHIPPDTVVVCFESAENLQLNRMLGIEAGGIIEVEHVAVNTHVSQAVNAPYTGAIIFNGKDAYNDVSLSGTMYNYSGPLTSGTAKKITFKYIPPPGNCLSGNTYRFTIILTDEM